VVVVVVELVLVDVVDVLVEVVDVEEDVVVVVGGGPHAIIVSQLIAPLTNVIKLENKLGFSCIKFNICCVSSILQIK
jgi:hypothetical protein